MVERMPNCPECGAPNPDDKKFCTGCGSRLPIPASSPGEEAETGRARKRSKLIWAIPVGIVLVAALGGVGYLVGSSGSGDSGGGIAADSTPAPAEELEDGEVEATLFSAQVPTGWTLERLDDRESSRFVSQWSDPESPDTSVLIDTQVLQASGTAMDSARQVREETSRSAGYREVSFEEIELSGRSTAAWVFELSGDRRIDYLFNQCGVGVAVLGAAPPERFDEVLPVFRQVAASVEVDCSPIDAESPISTQGIGPVLVGMTETEAELAGRIQFDSGGGPPGGECIYRYSEQVEGVSFMFNEGTLGRIDVKNPLSKTLSGIGVGDTRSDVLKTYGDDIEEEPNFYDPKNSSYLTFVPDDPTDDTRVLFDVQNGEVVNIRAGRLPEIEFVEGCA